MTVAFSDSPEFLTAVYAIDGPESPARAKAERICFDQTIEAEDHLLPPALRSIIVGHLEALRHVPGGKFEATIRFRADLLSGDCTDVLNVLFGTSSLRGNVTLLSFSMTGGLLSSWRGPRYGIQGLRRAVGVRHRPLLCAVLKPLGRSPHELAVLAAQFVEGGVDMIKDDQSLVDQPCCPFEERVARCADAIGETSARRGRACLYFAHVSGALDTMRRRAAQAKALGATGLLVAPGLTGFDSMRTLGLDDGLALPIASHPALLGAAVSHDKSGVAPAVLYGLLPRLVGADVTVYPAFGSDYPMTREDCLSVAEHCRQSWGALEPMMPGVGGRIGPERLAELASSLGRDTIFVLGSRVQKDSEGVVAAMKAFRRAFAESN
ncbi:MAG: ribulose 1,5-bisphosphate carboxylase large subunit [Nitrospira sp.]